jgi:hypothetical protein
MHHMIHTAARFFRVWQTDCRLRRPEPGRRHGRGTRSGGRALLHRPGTPTCMSVDARMHRILHGAPLINNELLLAQVGSSSAWTMGWSWEAALPLWVGVLKVLGRFLNNCRPALNSTMINLCNLQFVWLRKKTFAICRVFFVCGHLLPAYVSIAFSTLLSTQVHQSVLVARFGGFN